MNNLNENKEKIMTKTRFWTHLITGELFFAFLMMAVGAATACLLEDNLKEQAGTSVSEHQVQEQRTLPAQEDLLSLLPTLPAQPLCSAPSEAEEPVQGPLSADPDLLESCTPADLNSGLLRPDSLLSGELYARN